MDRFINDAIGGCCFESGTNVPGRILCALRALQSFQTVRNQHLKTWLFGRRRGRYLPAEPAYLAAYLKHPCDAAFGGHSYLTSSGSVTQTMSSRLMGNAA